MSELLPLADGAPRPPLSVGRITRITDWRLWCYRIHHHPPRRRGIWVKFPIFDVVDDSYQITQWPSEEIARTTGHAIQCYSLSVNGGPAKCGFFQTRPSVHTTTASLPSSCVSLAVVVTLLAKVTNSLSMLLPSSLVEDLSVRLPSASGARQIGPNGLALMSTPISWRTRIGAKPQSSARRPPMGATYGMYIDLRSSVVAAL